MDNNWKILNKRRDYKNPFMEVWKYEVVRPNGFAGPYYVLKRDSKNVGFSIIIPLSNKSTVYLVGQYRFPVGYYSWEFPMGRVLGKSALEGAKIELKQEIGLKAHDWKKLGVFHTAPGHSSEKATIFIARDFTIGVNNPEPGEILKIKEVTIAEIGDMIDKGDILDGPTIVAFHLLQSYLKK